MYTWGIGKSGQLGIDMKRLAGKTKCFMVPALVKIKNVTQISCFSNFSMCLDSNGKVYGFGSNLKGRIGLEERVDDEIEFPM